MAIAELVRRSARHSRLGNSLTRVHTLSQSVPDPRSPILIYRSHQCGSLPVAVGVIWPVALLVVIAWPPDEGRACEESDGSSARPAAADDAAPLPMGQDDNGNGGGARHTDACLQARAFLDRRFRMDVKDGRSVRTVPAAIARRACRGQRADRLWLTRRRSGRSAPSAVHRRGPPACNIAPSAGCS
jgi:hypothetical protein